MFFRLKDIQHHTLHRSKSPRVCAASSTQPQRKGVSRVSKRWHQGAWIQKPMENRKNGKPISGKTKKTYINSSPKNRKFTEFVPFQPLDPFVELWLSCFINTFLRDPMLYWFIEIFCRRFLVTRDPQCKSEHCNSSLQTFEPEMCGWCWWILSGFSLLEKSKNEFLCKRDQLNFTSRC